ncbi:Mechanosensitive ion channel [uncultured archaeon]|nr:Mechanosensitive ion channel [uncultured archaeon]
MVFYTVVEEFLTKIEIAFIVFFAGFLIAKLSSRILKKFLAEAELNRILESAGFKPISNSIASIVQYIIYTATLFIILQQFGLTKIVLIIIVILAFLVIAVSFLLAVRDFVPNVVAGLWLRKKLKPHIGKNIKIGNVKGKLKRVGIVSSIIEDREEYHVPHLYASKHSNNF